MNVVVDGLMTQYQITGGKNSSVALFLHGWADSSNTFRPLVAQLSESFTCIAVDLPGFGGTGAPSTAFGLEDYAHWVSAFMDKISQPTNVVLLVGHSNGGAIALKSLAAQKLTCEKLALIASAGVRTERTSSKKFLALAAKPTKAALTLLSGARADKIKQRAYSAIGSDYMAAGSDMQESFKKVVSEDVVALASQVSVPTVLVYGDEDEATPVRYGHAFDTALPNSQLTIVPGAGHFVHQSHTQAVVDALTDNSSGAL